jgi:hypothetical protein
MGWGFLLATTHGTFCREAMHGFLRVLLSSSSIGGKGHAKFAFKMCLA